MNFSLTTLGISSASPTVNRYPSAHVLNVHGRLFLIDCGEGCSLLLKRYGISIVNIECVFLSHLHGDHLFGIFPLLSAMSMLHRTSPLQIYAPTDFQKILDFYNEHFGQDAGYDIKFHEITSSSPENIIDTPYLQVSSFPLRHSVPTFGYIFSYHGKVFAYCSDTSTFEEEAVWLRDAGVSLLYHEVTFADDLQEKAAAMYHSTASDAARVAQKAGVQHLIIGHFSSRYNDTSILLNQARQIFPNTSLAQEGKIFEV